jgi:hypothetical protein
MTKKANALVRTKRDEDGLITEPKVEYSFDENGFIDWRKMLNDEWLYPNPTKYPASADISKLKDSDLCVLLQGYKDIAQIRGYTDVTYDIISPSADYVVATCSITWKPNYETENEAVIFSAIGDASPANTNGFGALYLGPMAENRAFVRCVRNFLKIGIVGRDELAGNGSPTSKVATARQASVSTESGVSTANPHVVLSSLMGEKGVTFEALVKRLKDEGYNKADKIARVEQIPKIKTFELIERIKSIKT